MRTVSFITRTSLALTAAAFAAGSADAALVVFDTFGAGAQTVTAAGSLLTAGVATGTSSASASIGQVAGSRNNRSARADWATDQNVAGLTTAQKSARSASTVVDSAAGVARMSFGGRLSAANNALTYASQVGGTMDFSSYDAVYLDGALTNATGFGLSSVLTLDIVMVDSAGINANWYFSANDANGGLTGLNGLLSANFVDFASFDPNDYTSTVAIDLSQIASFSVKLGYYDFSFGAPTVGATYSLGQISFNAVPAPGALALLAAAGVVGLRRRRT